MYESSSSLFFRTATGIQSGLDAFDESRLAMNFVINFEVTWILYSFRLVLKGKAAREIREWLRFEFLEKFFANNFALSEIKGNTLSLTTS